MFRVLAVMALRNLFVHKVKSLIVGLLMAFGTFLFVVGTSMLDSVEGTMTKSITSSIAGHLQVYDKDAKDDLALFGSGFMGQDDVGYIPNFAEVKRTLSGVEGVQAIVPMGLGLSVSSSPSELDRTLASLRRTPDDALLRERVRTMAAQLRTDLELRTALAADQADLARQVTVVERASSKRFWAEFEADPLAGLEWLDTQLAPISGEGWLFYLRYVATDPSEFAKRFERFEVVLGEAIPEGKRGFLFNQRAYEKWVKHPVARELDKIREAVVEKGQRIADDPTLQERVARNARQSRRVVEQLDAADARAVETSLRELLSPGEPSTGLGDLIGEFLANVDDGNVAARHAWFYEHIGPRIRLHEFKPGDVITLRSFTKSGYMRAVNVPVYGVFRFRGMEKSDLAGANNMIDLLTFRDLFGLMTEERRSELDAIRSEVGVRDIQAKDAEDALFGGGDELVGEASSSTFGALDEVDLTQRPSGPSVGADYTPEDLARGVVLNAAILLDDPDDIDAAKERIEAASTAAGLNLQVVDWRTAAGMVGQYIVAIRVVLYVAILIIFGVAIVIINNSMVMTTLERIREIGAMRAIGASRSFVLRMFVAETLFLGLVAGSAGALAGAGLVTALGVQGIPAPHDVLVFLFGGPRLHPSFGAAHLLMGFVAVVVVSLASTLYPARIAARVPPVVAMQPRE